MIRPIWPLIAIVALAGCQQPGPATDPFLYRSTIPPPGTSLSSAPMVTPGPQPYYSNAPAAVPGPSPCTPDTPAPIVQPAPVAPAPVVPVMPPRNYPQRGGFDGLQSSNTPPPATANIVASPVAAGAVAVATPEPPIRIVEPPVEHTAALPAAGLANPVVTSGTPTNPTQANTPPANTAQASPTPGVVLASAALPLAADPPAGAAPATAPPAAAPAAVNYPGDHPGLTYGYDPGYTALRGKLDYSVTARLWRLRYLPADGPIDEYGGSVVIADSGQVSGFEPGDFVAVQGALSAPAAGSNSATYAVTRIKRQ